MRIEWMSREAAGGGSADGSAGGMTRRAFIKTVGVASSGFALGLFIPGASRAQAPAAKIFPPNAFLHVAPDNTVTITINRLEFGQGVHTSLPMLVAEELDADWPLVRSELAPAADVYKDPMFGIQMTGGSGSVAHSYNQFREIGARARAMLVSAAAEQWRVKVEQCRTERSMVLGPAGQKATYGSLADAAMKLPVPDKAALKNPKHYRIIGRPTPRIDARAKVSGRQTFGIDANLPGMKVAVVARPSIFGGKVAKFDASKTLAIPGVRAALEVPTDRGGSGVAVIADGYWQAKQGREALQIEWDTAGLEKVDSELQLAAYKVLASQPGTVARDADIAALASAPKKIVAEYEFPYLAHAPMEPLNCLVDLKDDSCVVWTGSQFQTFDHAAIARTAGLKPEQVSLNTMMAGGGFGRRAVPTSDFVVEAVNVAKVWRASGKSSPVKVIWSREDDIHGGYYRPSHVHRAEIGFDEAGKVLAWNHTIVGQSILAGTPFEPMMVKNGVDSTMIEGMGEPYQVPMKLSVHNAHANVPVLWWRSVGSTHTAYVMETLIDELAQASDIDPVEYRKQLMGKDNPRHVAALDLAVEKSGYGKKKLPAGHAWGIAVHKSFDTVVAYVVEASIDKGEPKLHRVTGAIHCNRAINPMSIEAQAQGALLMGLGTTLPGAAITLKNGEVQQQNFSEYTVARMPNMPVVDIHIVHSEDPPTGMGEPGLPPLAPAFANAIAKLTGERLRKLPFDLVHA